MRHFLRNWVALLGLMALSLLVACGGIASDFDANTEHGRLQVTVNRAVNATRESVTDMKVNERLRYMLPVLARTLPLGAELYVDAAAREFGTYRHGGSWIFPGNLYLGEHTAMATIVEVSSSDPDVIQATVVPYGPDSRLHLAKLVALKPGKARLTFTVSKLDPNMRRIDPLVVDSIELTISEPRGRDGPAANPLRAKQDAQ